MTSKDNVNHPNHYTQGDIEVIDIIRSVTKDLKGEQAFCIGNAVKYLSRFQYKNGAEDLKKAIWYIERAIDNELLKED